MVEKAIVLRKVAEVQRYVADVRARVQADPARFEKDEDLHDLAGFHLLLALQNAVDLAFHLVADRGLSVPGSQREAFEALAREGAIDHSLAMALGDAASLRNRIAQHVRHGRLAPASRGSAATPGSAGTVRPPSG